MTRRFDGLKGKIDTLPRLLYPWCLQVKWRQFIWAEAFNTAVFIKIINRLQPPLKIFLPFRDCFRRYQKTLFFRALGVPVFLILMLHSGMTFSPKALECIFLGYSEDHKGYRCFDPTKNQESLYWFPGMLLLTRRVQSTLFPAFWFLTSTDWFE